MYELSTVLQSGTWALISMSIVLFNAPLARQLTDGPRSAHDVIRVIPISTHDLLFLGQAQDHVELNVFLLPLLGCFGYAIVAIFT